MTEWEHEVNCIIRNAVDRNGGDYEAAFEEATETIGDIPDGAMRWVRGWSFLLDADKEKIFWRNALTFLGAERAGRYSKSIAAGRARD